MPHARRTLLVTVALLGLALAGCEKGVKIGPWQVIQPKVPLVVSSFHMTRGSAPIPAVSPTTRAADEPRADGTQELVVDLNSGRATFTDTDGRPYPTQIDPARLEELRGVLTSRSWRIGNRGPATSAADPIWYGLTAYSGDKPVGEQAVWARPVSKEKKHPLPPAIVTLEETFEHASRTAHPISESVDLLK